MFIIPSKSPETVQASRFECSCLEADVRGIFQCRRFREVVSRDRPIYRLPIFKHFTIIGYRFKKIKQ